MAGIRTCDRESQVQRPNHYTKLSKSIYKARLQSDTPFVVRTLK